MDTHEVDETGEVEQFDPVLEPLPVKMVGTEKEATAKYASWSGTALTGNEIPFRLLSRSDKRHRAVIGADYTTVTGAYVLIGKREQVMNGQGARLYVGSDITIESEPEVWCAPVATNALFLSVLEERYS